jgi:uncharacterized integral membrane protein
VADERDQQDQGRRPVVRLVLFGILALLLIAFVADNTRRVRVSFVFGDRDARLIYVLIVTAAIGVLLDRLWLWYRHRKD